MIQPAADAPLFQDVATRDHAAAVSRRTTGRRYREIIQALAKHGPMCIWEIAEELGCFDHQISGRFGEMVKLGLIEKTGERRTKPATGCPADVYQVAGDLDDEPDSPPSTPETRARSRAMRAPPPKKR